MTGSPMQMSGAIFNPAATVQPERWGRMEDAKRAGSTNTAGTPPAAESLRALDWLNFLLAALRMGFGPFLGLYLADQGWMPANVGLVLTVSVLAGLLTQIPAGELIDTVKSKRVLVGTGAAAVTLGILTLGLRPEF